MLCNRPLLKYSAVMHVCHNTAPEHFQEANHMSNATSISIPNIQLPVVHLLSAEVTESWKLLRKL